MYRKKLLNACYADYEQPGSVVRLVWHTQTGVNTFSSPARQLRSQFQGYVTKYY